MFCVLGLFWNEDATGTDLYRKALFCVFSLHSVLVCLLVHSAVENDLANSTASQNPLSVAQAGI